MFHDFNRRLVISGLAVTMLQVFCTADSANAQIGARIQRPFNTPTVSPYLNLFRSNNSRGGNAILNYYGLVRPQQQAMQQNNALRNDFNRMSDRSPGNGQQNRNRRTSSMLGITGHPTSFMSLGGGGGGAGGGAGGGDDGGNDQQGFSGHSANVGTGYNLGNSSGFGGGGYSAGFGGGGGR